jgi:HSP20 family molecular chaperone IbpA
MPEVKVESPKTPARTETAVPAKFDFFAPMFPAGRFFNMNPFTVMREFTDDTWTPAIDVRRCGGAVVVTAELPGLKKEEVKVAITDTGLTIEGERRREHKEDHEGFHRFERSYGKFYRNIPLPEGAKIDLAKAELTDGVLKVAIPVPETKKAREIPIGTGAGKTAITA